LLSSPNSNDEISQCPSISFNSVDPQMLTLFADLGCFLLLNDRVNECGDEVAFFRLLIHGQNWNLAPFLRQFPICILAKLSIEGSSERTTATGEWLDIDIELALALVRFLKCCPLKQTPTIQFVKLKQRPVDLIGWLLGFAVRNDGSRMNECTGDSLPGGR
jgi:hypothetical protein